MSFLLYAGIIMAVMWFLQVFFLNNYYEDMKIKETENTATQIASQYKSGDDQGFIKKVRELSNDDDMYIRVDENGVTVYPSDVSELPYTNYIATARTLLLQSGYKSVSKSIKNKTTSRSTLVYATYLDKNQTTIMYMISPLYPVSSTKKIIRNQLVYIMIISLALAFILSFYISSKISRPITDITKSARRLADGQYGTTFHAEGQYTEIQNLADTLNKTSYELEKASMLQKDLMANVSHDLRTPLTMIKSYAEMIRDLSGDNPEKREKHLQVIIEESDRLNVLVTDVLELSRMQAGTSQIRIASFNIKDTLDQLVNPYHVLEMQEGYKIQLTCPAEQYVLGDEDKIKQVISNLLTNAVKYCGQDKSVFINVKHWGKIVHVEVIDHGMGIKPEELPYVWERYYKSSSHHVRTTTGSGLGLSIVKEILQLHKAKFGVESKVGKGTTFWFELEAADKPAEEEKA
jgi:signal transduction histidine kinase